MSEFVYCGLTADEAEQAIAGIWLSIERFGFPSPHLSIAFQGGMDRLSLRVKFENESVAVGVIRSLSTGSPAEHVGLEKPPLLHEDWRMVSQEVAQ